MNSKTDDRSQWPAEGARTMFGNRAYQWSNAAEGWVAVWPAERLALTRTLLARVLIAAAMPLPAPRKRGIDAALYRRIMTRVRAANILNAALIKHGVTK